MTPAPKPPVFLERRRYRLRRLSDAAHLLPILGFLLWALPAIRNSNAENTRTSADGFVYLFLVWFGLILAAFFLSRALRRAEQAVQQHSSDKAGTER